MTFNSPDFSTLPDAYDPRFGGCMMPLRRTDLAQLRQCVRGGLAGIEDGACISKAARNRLVAHGMLVRSLHADNTPRTRATAYGIETVRANSSCIDGSEGYTRQHEAAP